MASLFFIGLAALLVTRDMEAIRAFIREHGAPGLFLAVIVFTSLGATVIPSEPLTLLLVTLFGPLVAALVSSLGNLGAALVEYFIGTRLGNVSGFIERKEHLPWGLGKLPVTSPLFLIFGRMLPGYGAKLIGLISGIYRVPVSLFLWTSAIQTVLGAASAAYGISGLLSLFHLW